MTNSQHTGWFTGRTRAITIASLLAVGAAGALAVSANIGIIDAAPDSNVGSATASDLTTPQVIDVYLPASTTTAATSAATAAGVQEFAVDTAGTVAVAATDTGIRLESVSPAAGWSWVLSQSNSTQLMVSFTDGTRTLEFVATLNPDGTVAAAVNEPIVTAAPPTSSDDSHEDDDDDEYEGGGDDD